MLLLVLEVCLALLFTPDHVLVIMHLLPEVVRLLRRLIDFVLAYLCMRIHHVLIIVNFWCFEIIKWQNLDRLFVWSKMMDLLLVDKLFIVSHVVEDTGNACELKFGLDAGRIITNWRPLINRTFILLNSSSLIGAPFLGPLDLSGSTSASLRLGILLLGEVSDCLISSMRPSCAHGRNRVLDNVHARTVDPISRFGRVISFLYSCWRHTIHSSQFKSDLINQRCVGFFGRPHIILLVIFAHLMWEHVVDFGGLFDVDVAFLALHCRLMILVCLNCDILSKFSILEQFVTR